MVYMYRFVAYLFVSIKPECDNLQLPQTKMPCVAANFPTFTCKPCVRQKERLMVRSPLVGALASYLSRSTWVMDNNHVPEPFKCIQFRVCSAWHNNGRCLSIFV